MSNSEQAPLVPRNEPVYLDLRGKPAEAPAEFLRDSVDEVKWNNPTDHPIIVEIFMGTPTPQYPPRPPRNYFEKTGIRRYVWKPGETKSLDAQWTTAIQKTECQEPECLHRKYACVDPDHQHVIVGGHAPMLVNLGMQKRPTIHASLDDVEAQRRAVKLQEFEAYQRRQDAEIAAAKAKAEQEVLDRELQARAKSDAEAATAASKHQPNKK